MLRIHRIFLMLVLLLTAIPVVRVLAWKNVGEIVPLIERVAPAAAVAGDTVTITGFQLVPHAGSGHVRELYLSGSDARYQADILTQSDLEISFRVPANVPLGEMCIAMKLVGQTELVEQPVFLKIVEPVS
jgi:hypothetical protein